MKNNPFAIIAVVFALGVGTAGFVHTSLFLLFSGLFLFLLFSALVLKQNNFFILFFSLAVFICGILSLQISQIKPANHISSFLQANPQQIYLIAKVASSSEVSHAFYAAEKTVFTARAAALGINQNWYPVCGLVRVTAYGKRNLNYGEELLMQGELKRAKSLRNPGGFDYRAYLSRQNISAEFIVKDNQALLSLPAHGNNAVFKKIFQFKQRLSNLISAYFAKQPAALLKAILLGQRAGLPEDVKNLFIQTGTVHILAISGLHVGLIAFILIALFRFLRVPRRAGFILAILFLLCYAFLSGARASVVRATIMAVIMLIGFLLNREVKIYNSLGLAAILILALNPRQLFDAGFQLSFISVLSIVYLMPKIERLFPEVKWPYVYLTRTLFVSASAWIGTAPLAAYYFNIVSPVAILANLIIIPLLFLVVTTGITFLFFASVSPFLAGVFSVSSWLSLTALVKASEAFSKIPLAYFYCSRPGVLLLIGCYLVMLMVIHRKQLRLSWVQLVIILLLPANILVWKPLLKTESEKLAVTFLDVGAGDAIFIQFPGGQTMLIDGGPAQDLDCGEKVILPFLRQQGVDRINLVMLSHPDNDHVGGLSAILKNIRVDYILDNGMPGNSISYDNYKQAVMQNISGYRQVKRAQQISGFKDARLLLLHPPQPFLVNTESDTNNNSLVLKLAYRNISFLFCGDIETPAMQRLSGLGSALKAAIVKIPHHGGYEGRAEDAFLEKVDPRVAVISSGDSRSISKGLLRQLEILGAKTYNTKDSGAVTVSTDGRRCWVRTMVIK